MDIISSIDWKTISVMLGVLMTVGTISVTTFSGLRRFLLSPGYRAMKVICKIARNSEEYVRLIETIAAEFRPNGGSTIKDQMNRLENYGIITSSQIQSIMNYQDIPAFGADANGQYKWVSKAWCDLTEIDRTQASDNGWILGVHPEYRDSVKISWDKAIAENRDFDLEYRVADIGKPVYAHAVAVRDQNKNIVGYTGTLREL